MGEPYRFFAGLKAVHLVGFEERVSARNHQVFSGKLKAIVVVLSASHLFHFLGGNIQSENGQRALVGADKVDVFFIGRPSDEIHAVVPIGGEVGFLAIVEQEDAVFVGFISIVFHRKPSDFAAFRHDRIIVVAHHSFGEIFGGSGGDIVLIDVAIGGHGIVFSGFFAAHIEYALAVGKPSQLLHAAPRAHRRFELCAFEHIFHIAYFISIKVSHKGMGNFGSPFIPMAIH